MFYVHNYVNIREVITMKRLLILLVAIIFVGVTSVHILCAASTNDNDILPYLPAILASGGVSLNSDLVFEPSTIFVNENTQVTFGVVAKNVKNGNTIDVYECDANGKPLQKVLTLYDDGDLAKGDDIAGDGVFHNKMTIVKNTTKSTYFVAKIGNLTTTLARMIVANHFTDQELANVTAVQTQANTVYSQAISGGATGPQAIQQVGDYLNTQARVLTHGTTPDGEAAWWVDSSKVLCIYGPKVKTNSGLKGGRADSIPPELRNQKMVLPAQLKPGKPTQAPPSRLDFLLKSAADPNLYIDSNKAICLGMYKFAFEPQDEVDDIAQILKDGGLTVDEYYGTAAWTGSVDQFMFLNRYGAIVISSHGDNFYNGLFTWWKGKFGEDIPWVADGLSQVCILTNVRVTDTNKNTYEQDLVSQRLALFHDGNDREYVVLPAFIRFYSGAFPKSLVYASCCRSTYNNSLANAFLSKGAETYFGYSNYVHPSFAFPHGLAIFNQMVNSEKNTGEVTGVGDVDTGPDFARFDRLGATNLAFDLGLKNGDFETGDTVAWTGAGDTRVINALGPLQPPSGKYMAIISTGLGSVNDSISSLEQKFRIPTWAKTITFKYNVVSEEPMEWVGSPYDDQATVEITGDAGTSQLAAESVNTSVWLPISGIDFAGGDSTVFQTGWKTIVADVTAYQGKFVTLSIRCWDSGDSIYDTAMVIDAIKIQ
jgi:hypothetical protein